MRISASDEHVTEGEDAEFTITRFALPPIGKGAESCQRNPMSAANVSARVPLNLAGLRTVGFEVVVTGDVGGSDILRWERAGLPAGSSTVNVVLPTDDDNMPEEEGSITLQLVTEDESPHFLGEPRILHRG